MGKIILGTLGLAIIVAIFQLGWLAVRILIGKKAHVRKYRKPQLFDRKKFGVGIFTLFIVYVAFKILTPPSTEVAVIASPDGNRIARLRKFYYVSQPSYKIYYRDAGNHAWFNLLYLPSYTNVPHATASESIEWSPDSEHLLFKINGTTIWHHEFEP